MNHKRETYYLGEYDYVLERTVKPVAVESGVNALSGVLKEVSAAGNRRRQLKEIASNYQSNSSERKILSSC